MGKDKTHVNVVVIGHVDSGKSTTTGHLSEWSRRRLASRGHCLIVVLFSSASLQVWWY
jgi:translation elongation factor EF-Tu-like GTPase